MCIHYLKKNPSTVDVNALIKTAASHLRDHFATDSNVTPGLVYLATSYLMRVYHETKDNTYLLILAAALEESRARNHLNFQYQLILCRIYTLLGKLNV
jgi:hypothetical protein